MAYTTPTTHVAGETLPAADWNVLCNNDIAFRNSTGVVPATASVNAAAQSVTSATNTNLTFSSPAIWDTDTMFSAGSPTQLTVNTTGLYIVTTHISFVNGTSGFRFGAILVNSTVYVQFDLLTNTTADPFEISSAETLSLTAADTLKFRVYHTQGTSLSVSGRMQATLLGRTS